jgi:ribosome recycling factor
MPTFVRLGRDDLNALAAWLRDQLDDDRSGRAHAAILEAITPHLHQHTAVGQLARHTLMQLATIYDQQPGYRDDWRP